MVCLNQSKFEPWLPCFYFKLVYYKAQLAFTTDFVMFRYEAGNHVLEQTEVAAFESVLKTATQEVQAPRERPRFPTVNSDHAHSYNSQLIDMQLLPSS